MLPSRWVPAILLALTFALGLSLGYILRSELFQEPFREARLMRGPGRGGPGDMPPPFVLERLGNELRLSPEQRMVVDKMLETHRMRMNELRDNVIRPRQQAIMDSTRIVLIRTLTPEQMDRFRVLRRNFRPENFRGPGGPPFWREELDGPPGPQGPPPEEQNP